MSGISFLKRTGLNLVTVKITDNNYKKSICLIVCHINYFQLELQEEETGVVEDNYDVLAGNIDSKEIGLILAVDSKNEC